MLHGALIGLGQVAMNGHLPAWKSRSDFQIIAGIDSAEVRTDLFKKEMPQAAVYKSLEDCLAQEKIDFVDIATPPHTHFNLIKESLRAGLNVLCEKPLVLKPEELKEIEFAAQESNKVLITVHNWKYAPICRKISELILSGAIGQVQRLEWYVLRSGPSITTEKDNWRLNPEMSGGGILVDHGWHAFYLILEWLSASPKKIRAELENRQYEDLPVEDTAKIKIEFNGGSNARADILLTWASRLRKNSGLIEGTEGRILMEDDRLIVEHKGRPAETISFEKALSAGSFHADWFGFVIDEFAEEVKNPALEKNFKIAQSCFHLIQKSKESSEKRAEVLF